MARSAFLVGCTFIFFISGCIGDPFLTREIEVTQVVETGVGETSFRFHVDLSQIPANWMQERSRKSILAGPWSHDEELIRLSPKHAVKIMIVPEQPTTQPTTSEGSHSMPKKVAALLDQMRAELPAFQKRWGATGTYTFYASINPSGLDTTYTGSMPIGGDETRLAYAITAPNNPPQDSDVAAVTIIHDGDSGTNQCQHMPTLWHWQNNQWVSSDVSALESVDRFFSQFKTVERNKKPADTKPARSVQPATDAASGP